MKIGIISDIHSNNYVLEKLFLKEKKVDYWISAGDNVGLFPNVNSTLELLQKNKIISVSGDHEFYLTSDNEMSHSFSGNESIKKQKQSIKRKNLEYVKKLKQNKKLEFNGNKIFITHKINSKSRSLFDSDKYKYDYEKLEGIYREYDFVISGHTHIPSVYYGKKTIFINPGSIGFPVCKLKRPSYVIVDLKSLKVSLKAISFNSKPLIKDIIQNNYNEKFVSYLEKGFNW